LRRWETLRSEFDARGIQVLTVSTDTVEELQNGRDAHGLQAIMLSDSDLKVTDAFGLRNTLVHSAPPGDEQEALPVPASLLVDRDGKVLWLELSENYQRRSGAEVVLAAIEEHLGPR
jgi:peroxiredoxin